MEFCCDNFVANPGLGVGGTGGEGGVCWWEGGIGPEGPSGECEGVRMELYTICGGNLHGPDQFLEHL